MNSTGQVVSAVPVELEAPIETGNYIPTDTVNGGEGNYQTESMGRRRGRLQDVRENDCLPDDAPKCEVN